MELGPILRALLRNKTGAILIALQIAFTMTVIVNALFMIEERTQQMARPSGLVEADIFYLTSTGFATDFNHRVTIEEDLALLRQTPGIVDAIQINTIPLSGGGWSMGLQTEPGEEFDATSVALYMVDSHGINTMGVNLIAGENFSETEIEYRERSQTSWPPNIIISEAMASELFPDNPMAAVGKTVYISANEPITITGIIERLQAPWSGWGGVERTMLVPTRMLFGSRYLIRTEPGRLDEMMPQIEELLASSNTGRIIRGMRSMPDTRARSYLFHSGMSTILTIVVVVLTAITGLGIVGLASFSVNRRTKQIGTRRALGATKGDILRYFLVENFVITTFGVVLGGAMTIGFNVWLTEAMSLPKIDLMYVPIGMGVLWIIGQLAVLGPARRACAVPPAVATRTV
ncbi:MAG: ABC transporter permease [Gammaproteobacteria bacterium]|nr:ABC transporter permease [Gammaproteobacteria bacterium]